MDIQSEVARNFIQANKEDIQVQLPLEIKTEVEEIPVHNEVEQDALLMAFGSEYFPLKSERLAPISAKDNISATQDKSKCPEETELVPEYIEITPQTPKCRLLEIKEENIKIENVNEIVDTAENHKMRRKTRSALQKTTDTDPKVILMSKLYILLSNIPI